MVDHAERGRLLGQLIDAGSWELAAEAAGSLVADDPSEPKWQRAAGQCALHLDDAETAVRHLGEALSIAPEDHRAHYFMAHAERLRGRVAEAEAAVRRAIEIQPAEADYWTELGWLAFERDDHSAALRCANRACEIAPENSRASTLLAAAESLVPPAEGGTRGDPAAQIASLRRTLEIDPDNDAALHNIGIVYFNELRDYRAAERQFRHALSLAPGDRLYQKNLARALRRQDPVARALDAPFRFVEGIFSMVARGWEKRWPVLLALPVLPFLFAGALAILLFWAVTLWPPSAFYSFITRPDTMAAAGHLTPRSHYRAPLSWSRPARLTLFLAAFTAFWLALIPLFRALAFRLDISRVLIALVATWLAVTTYACARELLTARERRTRGGDIDWLEREGRGRE